MRVGGDVCVDGAGVEPCMPIISKLPGKTRCCRPSFDHSVCLHQERIRTAGRVRTCNSVKFETGWN